MTIRIEEIVILLLQQFYVIVGGCTRPGAVALKDAPLFVVLLSAAENRAGIL